MNKFGMVLGVAAVAVIAGCKDPDYKHGTDTQTEVMPVDTTPAPYTTQGNQIEVQVKHCTCAPGTKHDRPCQCGAPDCRCTYAEKPAIKADLSKPAVVTPAQTPAVEPETTIYIVQSGDYLAKISKKYNVTIASIKKLNPSIKENNIVRVGQKIKLPGKIDVGVQAEPAKAVVKPTKKAYAPYAGATKEYVVKNGDTLGAIAYSNGINIRQLKELNGLSSDKLRIGQKLKIPAEKVVAPKPSAKVVKNQEKKPSKTVAPAVVDDAKKEEPVPPAVVDETKKEEPVAPAVVDETKKDDDVKKDDSAAPQTMPYVVQEGDDITGIAIRWGVSTAVIRALNNLGENDQLVPGQIIKLPADAQQ